MNSHLASLKFIVINMYICIYLYLIMYKSIYIIFIIYPINFTIIFPFIFILFSIWFQRTPNINWINAVKLSWISCGIIT